jgi:HSP20 family protein
MSRALESVTKAWRDFLVRITGRATYFRTHDDRQDGPAQEFSHWSLLATETWETAQTVVIRIEVPGMSAGELTTEFHGNALHIRGEKRSGSAQHERRYHLRERAYGKFERRISLPRTVDSKRAEIAYRDGILTVILPKTEIVPPHAQRNE